MSNQIPSRHLGKLLITIFILNIIEYLQAGMIAFAANPIMGETGTSPEEFGMVSAVYACIAILMIAKQHWMVERLGWRRYIQIGLSFFILGALVCTFSHSFSTFLAGRAIMALGGASFMTSSRLLTLLIPPSPVRFMGIKAFVVSMTTGMALSPWLASLIVSSGRWNLIFVLLIAFAILAFIFTSLCLPTYIVDEQERMTKSNPVLIFILLLGGFAFFYVFRRSSYDFYSDTMMLLCIFVLSTISLSLFFRRLQKIEERPLLHVKPIFQDKAFIFGTFIATCFYIMSGANNYILPITLQRGLNFSWSSVGFFNSLGLSTSILAWIVFSKIVPKYPSIRKFCVIGGLAVFLYGYFLSNLTIQANLWTQILPALLANGVFIIMVMTPVTAACFRSLQKSDLLFSHAMQVRNMLAQLSISLGISLGTALIQWRTTVHFSIMGENYTNSSPAYLDALQKLTTALSASMPQEIATQTAASQLQQLLLQHSTLMAGIDYFHCVMIFGMILTVVMFFQKILK
ncbi:MFS transporter [Neisseria sp. Ec49-e6-T10]|uniref:MFS transporter n=1 Tax=Neisseria sp. Ec49-e6-T10 TaxID=3140744 RepID=UPI003EB892F8